MKSKSFLGLIVLAMGLVISAALAEQKTYPIHANSCRLYNAYYMKGQLQSDSQGTVYNGAYETAPSMAECQKKCLSDEQSRTRSLPSYYTLSVECFYGYQSVYRKANIGASN